MGLTQRTDICVYTHSRLSDGVVFYVGIGTPKRPYEGSKRNVYWKNTVKKYAYTITIVHKNLTWEQACAIEIDLIKKYREISGDKLCNMTDGGDGSLGSNHCVGRKHSLETRAKIGASQIGRVFSEDTRAKLRAAKLGKKMTESNKEKLRAANKGRVMSQEHKAKLLVAHLGKKLSRETIMKREETRRRNTSIE